MNDARRKLDASRANEPIAGLLDAVANVLEEQHANQFRVQAWRNGAATLRNLEEPASTILRDEGLEGLDRLPNIGAALSRAIREIVQTGRLALLERLRGETESASILATVPGVGPALAERLDELLDIQSLEALELAACDGRLATVPGFGPKRIAGIRDALAARLRSRVAETDFDSPPVSELLDVDRDYRERAAGRTLPTIAPRRFNPLNERWLPVLHTVRGERHYTALFSNTAQAHRVGRTRDWVILYYDGRAATHQATVVTALKGPLIGRRVVRGREHDCITHYHVSTAA